MPAPSQVQRIQRERWKERARQAGSGEPTTPGQHLVCDLILDVSESSGKPGVWGLLETPKHSFSLVETQIHHL